MSITVEFKDFEEMKDFARELLGTGETDARKAPEPVKAAKAEKPQVLVAPVQPETPAEQKPEKEPEAESSAAPPEDEDSISYSLEDVRAKLAALNKSGKRAQVKELLTAFGVEKLSEIAPELYAGLMEKAEVL